MEWYASQETEEAGTNTEGVYVFMGETHSTHTYQFWVFYKKSQGTPSWLGFLILRAYFWAVLLPLFVTHVIDTEGFTCFFKKVQKCPYPTFILGKYDPLVS